MTTKRLLIKQLVRFPQYDGDDTLVFKPGVNVIVGKPNSGKTKWLCMLDYLMGDPDKPENTFSAAVKEKYDSVRALVAIGDEEIWLERRWKRQGELGKVFWNEKPIHHDEFSATLLEKLGIPVLHFSKGNPYEERAWPELSWRTLLRHIYRRQRFWGDIADKQPESEQLASLLQFTGIADRVYSDAAGALVDVRKQIWKLQGAKEQYLSMLDEIAREITDEDEFRVALTADSIDASIARLRVQIQGLEQKRESALSALRNDASKNVSKQDGSQDFEDLGQRWADRQVEKEISLEKLRQNRERLEELKAYQANIMGELGRMERAKDAGEILTVLKVTHCPACDQPIVPDGIPGHCYLCGQVLGGADGNDEASTRLDLEIERLQEDLKEAQDLTQSLSEECKERQSSIRRLEEEINRLENRLRPVRQSAAAILPPEISIWDMETGRLEERIRQLLRIQGILDAQDKVSRQIDKLHEEEEKLKAKVQTSSKGASFETASQWLSDGMNTYLNALDARDKKVWSQDGVNFRLRERDFTITVGGQEWGTQLGGTLILYFLLSYHYSLLRLSRFDRCNYPGLAIIDLPATLEDGSTIQDKENFVIEPFIGLLNKSNMKGSQMIITGSAFEGLEDVNRISLRNVWQ